MKALELNPDYVAWAERAGIDPSDCRRDGIDVVQVNGEYRIRYLDRDGRPREAVTMEKPPPLWLL